MAMLSSIRVLAALSLALGTLTAAEATDRVLRYTFQTEETGFDPVQIDDQYSRSVTSNIFDAPLRFKWFGNESVENNVLDRDPEISSDFKTFTFHLRHDIYFAPDAAFNGKKRELTAEDFVYSMKRIYDPRWKSQSYGALARYKIRSLEKLREDALKNGHFDYDTVADDFRAIDRYTWQVHVSVPSPRWPIENYTDPSTMGAVAREVVEKYGDSMMEHPVGTGAYMLSDWLRASHITLVKNPNYREDIYHVDAAAEDPDAVNAAARFNGKRMPFLDRIEISIIDESQPRWLSFLNAEQDLAWPVAPDLVSVAYPNNKLAPNLNKKHFQVWRAVDMTVFQFLFNMDDPVVGGYTADKVALRRAISYGINTPSEIANVYGYQGTLATSSITPGQIGYTPNIRTESSQYSPIKANAILDTYGYLPKLGEHWRNLPNGQPFSIEYSTRPTQVYRQISEIVKKSFDEMGIRMTIKTALWSQLLKEAQAGTFQTWYVGNYSSTTDPGEGMQASYGPAKGGANLSRFDLPQFNALYEKQSTIPDSPERMTMIQKMVELENAYMPYKYMFNSNSVYLAQPWVIGWYPDNLLYDWWRYVDVDPLAQAPYLN